MTGCPVRVGASSASPHSLCTGCMCGCVVLHVGLRNARVPLPPPRPCAGGASRLGSSSVLGQRQGSTLSGASKSPFVCLCDSHRQLFSSNAQTSTRTRFRWSFIGFHLLLLLACYSSESTNNKEHSGSVKQYIFLRNICILCKGQMMAAVKRRSCWCH